MKITLLPKARAGKWSEGMGILSLVTFIILIIAGYLRNHNEIYSNALNNGMFIVGITMVISGAIALITGIIDVWKNKERSIIIFLSIFIGLITVGISFLELFE
jgi:hypothetical protein